MNDPISPAQESTVLDGIVGALPALFAWCGVLMSAWVYDALPEHASLDPQSALFTFFGAPLGAFVIVLVDRAASKRRALAARKSDCRTARITLKYGAGRNPS
jgi:hypothetical protein